MIEREGGVDGLYGTDAERRLFVARARYESGDRDPSVFDEFTPRRAELGGADRVAYDAEVSRIMERIAEGSVHTADGGPLDASMRYLIASGLVESYGVDSELLDLGLDQLDGGWVVSHDGSSGVSVDQYGLPAAGTFFHSGGSSANPADGAAVGLLLRELIDSVASPDDGYDLVTHEFAHVLDFADGISDGIPAGMSPADGAILTSERARLFGVYEAGRVPGVGMPGGSGIGGDTSGLVLLC